LGESRSLEALLWLSIAKVELFDYPDSVTMETFTKVEFALRDQLADGRELTPESIGLARFNEFHQQVAEFITGAEGLDLDGVVPHVEKGSHKLVLMVPFVVMSSLAQDLRRLEREDVLGELDPKRAGIIQKWQSRAKKSEHLSYSITTNEATIKPIHLHQQTDFREGEIVPWVKVERYLVGTVVTMGGSAKANVHIKLDGSAKPLVAQSNQSYLRDQDQNRLYHQVLARVQAEQHWRTRELRNIRLLSFEPYEPVVDEAALDRFAEAGAKAWADVPDGAAWVRQMRGGLE